MAGTKPPHAARKLTRDLQDRLVKHLADGIDRRHACEQVGITLRTLQRWLKAGREGEGKAFVSLVSQVKKAEADAVVLLVGQVRSAALGGAVIERRTFTKSDGTQEVVEKFARPEWTAAAWWLERRRPKEYSSDRKRVKELERLLAEIVKGGAGGAGNAHPPRRTPAAEPGGGGYTPDRPAVAPPPG